MACVQALGEAITGPDEMAATAPRVISIKIPVDKIGEVIGPKGKIINQIQEDTGADITIEDDGTIYIGATDGPSAEAARLTINQIANPTMPEVGERYLGTVVKTTNFGAFMNLGGKKDGLIGISQGVHAFLKEHEVPHIWHVADHAHDAPEWKQALFYFVQKVFK